MTPREVTVAGTFLRPDWKELDMRKAGLFSRMHVKRYWFCFDLDIDVAQNRATGKYHYGLNGRRGPMIQSAPFNTPEWAMACAQTAAGTP